MAIYNVLVRFTGFVDMEIEADDAEVCGWDVDIEDCEREDD